MLAAALVLGTALAGAADDSHQAPVAPVPAVFAERQRLLSELWLRGVLPTDSESYTERDEELLEKMRLAEAAGAIHYLRARGPVGRLVAGARAKDGRGPRLTKAGYERWRLLRTQDALAFFQSKDIGAKDAFLLTDLDGQALFEKDGLLGERGQTVLNLIQAGLEAHWVTPSGEVLGNRAPPRSPSAGRH